MPSGYYSQVPKGASFEEANIGTPVYGGRPIRGVVYADDANDENNGSSPMMAMAIGIGLCVFVLISGLIILIVLLVSQPRLNYFP